MNKFSFHHVVQLEYVMSDLDKVVKILGDVSTKEMADELRFLLAEVRVFASAPHDPEMVKRFQGLFKEIV